MKNEEMYKTVEERQKAFNCFCMSQKNCGSCPVVIMERQNKNLRYSCEIAWLSIEDEPAILPCPICGKEPVLVKADNHGESIGCPDCGLHLNCKSMTETVPELVARWNTRWDGTEEHKN